MKEIVVAHGGLLYGIYPFDNSRTALTPSQRQALASLRFIPHIGPALRPYGTNALVAALYNPCLDLQRTAPTARPVAARLTVSFSISGARGNEMVAANVTGTGFRPDQEMVLTACWNRAVHPTYTWYHQIAHVHANRYGTLPTPTMVPTFVMYVPSGRFRSWDVRVVAADARTGHRLAVVARGPSAGSVAHSGATLGSAASPCLRGSPAATVCQRAVGVALVPPAGWRVAPPGAAEAEGLTLVSHGISRLSIVPLAVVSPKYEACAVASVSALL